MKKIAVFLGAFGFLLMIGAAGGADGSSFGVTVLCEAIGITLLLASEPTEKTGVYCRIS